MEDFVPLIVPSNFHLKLVIAAKCIYVNFILGYLIDQEAYHFI